jgi:hypothetical protein
MFSFLKGKASVPGGFKVGDTVYFCGASESLPSGNHLEYAKVGKISGVAAADPRNQIAVHFRGNKGATPCFINELCRAWPPPRLPSGLRVGTGVFYIGASNRWSHDNINHALEYGGEGTVAGASATDPEKRVTVSFSDNKEGWVDCAVALLSCAWPPPPLPGGFEVGDTLYYCGASETLPSGRRLDHGGQGVVAGASSAQSEGKVAVRFVGNPGSISCFLSTLSRAWPPPPLPGGMEVGDKVHWCGKGRTLPSGERLVHGQQGEVAGAVARQEDRVIAVRFEFPPPSVGAAIVNCWVHGLSRTWPPDEEAEALAASAPTAAAAPSATLEAESVLGGAMDRLDLQDVVHARPWIEVDDSSPRADVLLSPDSLSCILDVIGLNGVERLAPVCRAWRAAVAARLEAWCLLRRVRTIGGFGGTLGKLEKPCAVASLPGGAACVADTFNNRLQIFSQTEQKEPRLVGSDGAPGQFSFPCGVVCDGEVLFVSDVRNVNDSWAYRVQKLRLTDCEPLASVGGAQGDGAGKFDVPMGLCLTGDALYCCDSGNHRVVALGTDLTWKYTFGKAGPDLGEFHYPMGIASLESKLYVVDNGNHRVQVFAPGRDGQMKVQRVIGDKGSAPGQFLQPRDVATVRSLLVVTEDVGGRVQVLTPQGVPLQVLPFGSKLAGLCASEGRVWVVSYSTHQVHELLTPRSWREKAARDTKEHTTTNIHELLAETDSPNNIRPAHDQPRALTMGACSQRPRSSGAGPSSSA